jgi:hypothetical protein
MKYYNVFLILAGVYFISSCAAPINVSTDFDEAVNFSTLKVYRWHSVNQYNNRSKKYLASDIVDQRLRNNVDQQLAAKGFRIKKTGAVDFLVNYTVTVEDKTDISTYNTYQGYAPGFRYGMRAGSFGSGVSIGYSSVPSTKVINYRQGTLVIDILKPKTDKLIWRGMADGRLPKKQTQQESKELLVEVVSKTLENFPPEAQ